MLKMQQEKQRQKESKKRQLENALVGPDESSSISTLLVLQLHVIILECHCMLGEGRYHQLYHYSTIRVMKSIYTWGSSQSTKKATVSYSLGKKNSGHPSVKELQCQRGYGVSLRERSPAPKAVLAVI